MACCQLLIYEIPLRQQAASTARTQKKFIPSRSIARNGSRISKSMPVFFSILVDFLFSRHSRTKQRRQSSRGGTDGCPSKRYVYSAAVMHTHQATFRIATVGHDAIHFSSNYYRSKNLVCAVASTMSYSRAVNGTLSLGPHLFKRGPNALAIEQR